MLYLKQLISYAFNVESPWSMMAVIVPLVNCEFERNARGSCHDCENRRSAVCLFPSYRHHHLHRTFVEMTLSDDDSLDLSARPSKRQRRDQSEAKTQPLLRILDRDAAYDALFSHCTPATIHHLSLACRAARRAVSDYNSRAYDINRHFNRFFRDPVAFRRMQMYTGSVVSGSSALQFFDRTLYPDADLDIYADKDQAEIVGKWIMDQAGDSLSGPGAQMGYNFVPRENQPPDFFAALKAAPHQPAQAHPEEVDEEVPPGYPEALVSGVFSFIANSHNGHELKVQLILCYEIPIKTILQFHSSECVLYLGLDNLLTMKSCCHEHNHIPIRLFVLPTSNIRETAESHLPER